MDKNKLEISKEAKQEEAKVDLLPELKLDTICSWILSVCHSLVLVDKEMVGDPLE